MTTEMLTATRTNPFPGLRPFEFDESHLFFGRDGQSEQVLRKLSATRFVAIVGTSGSGKSSLARAGLLPELYGGMMPSAGSNWRVAIMRPGNNPIGNLAQSLNEKNVFGSEHPDNAKLQATITEATLRRGSLGLIEAVRQAMMPASENLLVLVDQFEEIFRFAKTAKNDSFKNEAAAFVKLLLEAGRQRDVNIYVILTMRSDFLGDCSLFRDLPEAINEGQYLVPRLTRDQLREAITGPIAVAGATITPRLLDRLLNEVGDDQDQLPVLQHALMRTWDEWEVKQSVVEGKSHRDVHQGTAIDLCCYEAVGGMAKALSRHADEAYNELLDDHHRLIAERMFKCLTEKGDDNREIRRPVTLKEIGAVVNAPEAEVIRIIDIFRRPGRSFLMPPAETKLHADSLIDISHESLIRVWTLLSQWVKDESLSSGEYLWLVETAIRFRAGRESLLGESGLQAALDWRDRQIPNQHWAQRYHTDFAPTMQFLEDSRTAREKDIERYERLKLEAEEKRKRELRRTRVVAAVLLAAFMVSLACAAIAWQQKASALKFAKEAEKQKGVSEAATKEANKRRTEAEVATDKADEQKHEAEASAKLATKQTARAEAATKEAKKKTEEAHTSATRATEQTKIAEANQRMAAAESEKSRHLFYATSMNLARSEFEAGNRPRGYELMESFLPTSYASTLDDVRSFYWYYLWKQNHNEKATFTGHTSFVSSVAFSSDGRTLATGSVDKTVKLWDVASQQELGTLKGHTNSVNSVVFSSDGRTLATGSRDKTVKLWDIASQQELGTLKGHTEVVYSVAFSSDGKMLATGSWDKTVKLWDMASQQELGTLKGHTGFVSSVAFSSDGKTLTTGSEDGTVKLWEVASQQEPATLKGHTEVVTSVAFSSDGKTLATGSEDSTVKLWDVASRQELGTLKGRPVVVSSVAFSSDGKTLATGSEDSTVKLWDVASRQELGTLKGHTEVVTSVAFSSDGKTLATGSRDSTVKLWDMASQQELGTLKGHTSFVSSVAFSSDGKMLATGSWDKTVKLWDMASQQELGTLKGFTEYITSLAFRSDGKMLAMGSRDKTVKLWDMASQQKPATLKGHTEVVTSVTFSSDGKTLATGSGDGTVKLWDIASQQELATLKGHTNSVTSVAFSSDGKTLATGSGDGTVKLYTTATKEEVNSQRSKLPEKH